MSVRGIVGPSAVEVFVAYGPFGRLPPAWVFDRGPDEGEWSSALANQTDLRVTAQDAMTAVRTAWLAAGGGLDSFRTK